MRNVCIGVIALLLVTAVWAVEYDTLVLRQGLNGYSGCFDTYLNNKAPLVNYDGDSLVVLNNCPS